MNLLLLVTSLVLLVLFFRKSGRFPRLFIMYVIASLIVIVIDAMAVRTILPDEPIFDPQTAQEFGKALIGAVIWIPYMLVSKRVKNTFGRASA